MAAASSLFGGGVRKHGGAEGQNVQSKTERGREGEREGDREKGRGKQTCQPTDKYR